ncbi:HAD family hydrolase [Candidatus Peregrinibacteria bacterium CG_4_10_14_0_2_um_filter_43_11]|nr:MAG: HAD family hydrolase [Candidatus Peregrinibacteria bacterium CG_4_10_14_0_2_um_filter_43_11]
MAPFFYQLSVDQAAAQLKTNLHNGLNQEEAQNRLSAYGLNSLAEKKRRSVVFRFFDQFKDLMIIVLIVAALLAYYLGDFRGGTILLVIVFANAVIGFYQEYKAERILQSLKDMIKHHALVIRDGQRMEIDSTTLVPGDLVYLEEGSSIPADIRLTETVHFSTNDFILTGESVPQAKKAESIFDQEIAVTDQDNLVFLGTTVAKGNAFGVVCGTGMNTVIGRIAATTATIHESLSPLQRELNILAKALTKIAGVIALSLFVINTLLHIGDSESIKLTIEVSFLFAISVAAACIPQGLPAQISVVLSLGVWRMARKNAVVKKLSSVETLGSTMVICSDKTGTITKNEMTILDCFLMNHRFRVSGDGYEPTGAVLDESGQPVSHENLLSIKQFFQDGFLASNGRVLPPDAEHKGWYAVGDPTEAAFCTLAMKAGLDLSDLETRFPRIAEIPFDSDRKRMTIVREHNGKTIAYMKGGVESVLSVCSRLNQTGEIFALTEELKKTILKEAESYSKKSLRVIALAYRDFSDVKEEFSIESTEADFVFAGFVTMMDPPRAGVPEAIQAAYDAHIRIMMITGDNAITAKAIAEKIGMKNGTDELSVFTGDDIKNFTDEALKEHLKKQSIVFARVSPDDKYRIVTLLSDMGNVVAVTGDGVNDTLSLKRADIGVSMGKLGSEVAKEASEIVLLDDNFSTLVTVIREGRTIFQNLKKTILSSVTSNNGELTCVLLGFIGIVFGLPAPITAVQILAVDLVGEMLPLTALTFDSAERSLMSLPPRDLNEHIINRKSLINLIFYGFWMGAAGFFAFIMVYLFGTRTVESGRAAAYGAIILCQFMNILSRRTNRTIFTEYLFTNIQLWGSFLISLIAISILIYVPSVSIWFGFASLSLQDWLFPILGALVFLSWHEAHKYFLSRA